MKSLVTKIDTFEMDIVSINVFDRPVQSLIDSAGYKYVNENIKGSKILIHKPGIRPVAIWHPNRIISTEGANKAMKSMTTDINGETYKGRPGTIEDLVSFEIEFFEDLKGINLVALGEKVFRKLTDSIECVAYRYYSDTSKHRLHLRELNGEWESVFCFLVVFEKLSESE